MNQQVGNIQYQQQMAINSSQKVQPQYTLSGDMIEQLPTDGTVPSHNELLITDKLFQQKKKLFDRILSQTKDIIVLCGLFIIFSLPIVDDLIKKFVTIANTSQYILIGTKALLFIALYFVIKNLYLIRK